MRTQGLVSTGTYTAALHALAAVCSSGRTAGGLLGGHEASQAAAWCLPARISAPRRPRRPPPPGPRSRSGGHICICLFDRPTPASHQCPLQRPQEPFSWESRRWPRPGAAFPHKLPASRWPALPPAASRRCRGRQARRWRCPSAAQPAARAASLVSTWTGDAEPLLRDGTGSASRGARGGAPHGAQHRCVVRRAARCRQLAITAASPRVPLTPAPGAPPLGTPLADAVIYKSTRFADVVVQRRARLFADRLQTQHSEAPSSGDGGGSASASGGSKKKKAGGWTTFWGMLPGVAAL